MDEYISKQAFKDKYLCCGYLPEMSETEFDTFPAADVVEVVRCKNCRFFSGRQECYCHAADENGTPIFVREDDFCSYGSRMEKEDEREAD